MSIARRAHESRCAERPSNGNAQLGCSRVQRAFNLRRPRIVVGVELYPEAVLCEGNSQGNSVSTFALMPARQAKEACRVCAAAVLPKRIPGGTRPAGILVAEWSRYAEFDFVHVIYALLSNVQSQAAKHAS
jgi:hypothetical protein